MSNHVTNWDKANNESKIVNESLTAELERYKERVKILKQRFNVDLNSREKFIDSQMDYMVRMKNTKFAAFETEIDTLKQTLSKHVKEKESLLTTLNGFKTKFKEIESKSIDKEIVLENKNKELENIVSLGYQNPFYLKRAQRIKPILYDGNLLSKTHDVLSVVDEEETLIVAEESRLKMVEKQNHLIMKKEKINITLINYSKLNKLSKDFGKCFVPQKELSTEQMFLLQSSNKNSEEPSTSNTLVKIEVPSELTKGKLKETIHLLRENVNPAKVKQDIDEIETINIELEHSVAKLLSENEKLYKEKKHLKNNYKELYDSIKPTRVHEKEQCASLIANLNSKSMENADLKAQIKEKVFANASLKNELRKLKGKIVIGIVVSKPHATTIAPGMFKLDLESLAPKVLKNKDAHLDYIKHSREHADTLQEIVKSARALSPLDSNLESAFRSADPVTSSSNTQKQVDSHKPKDSNQALLHSTGVIGSTGASGSKPIGNTKNNRISKSSSSNKTNKVEDQSRSVKSRKNKKNRVTKTECNSYVMQSMLNANSKSVCAICNECLFDANHDKYVLDYVHDVNVLSKSKPAKRKSKKQIWRPTGIVYTEIAVS
ncbi:hypothetical protein Tco_0694758 [Tanacetum coccineum]